MNYRNEYLINIFYSFQVIEVRQGPKWFIWPSSSSSHSSKKHEKNNKSVENNDKENINQTKPTLQISNGYVSGSGSDQEHTANKTLSSSPEVFNLFC